MEKFTCDLIEYEKGGKCIGKWFQRIIFETKITWIKPGGHYFLPYGSLLGQYFQKIGSLFGSL